MHSAMNVVRAILRAGTGLAFLIIIVAVTIQVVSRSLGSGSPVWTEELTRFALLWLAAFGTALSLWSGDLVNVDLLSEALPGRAPWILRLISALIVAAICLLVLPAAWRFTRIGAMQSSPAMGLSMSWVHASVLFLLAALALAAILRVAAMLTGASDGRPEHQPGDIA